MTQPLGNRRTVKGTAFRTCNYCGRHKIDREGRPFNFQYLNEHGEWDADVYCTKACRQAWHTENACAEVIRRSGL